MLLALLRGNLSTSTHQVPFQITKKENSVCNLTWKSNGNKSVLQIIYFLINIDLIIIMYKFLPSAFSTSLK